MFARIFVNKCLGSHPGGSNSGPRNYEFRALPTELGWQNMLSELSPTGTGTFRYAKAYNEKSFNPGHKQSSLLV